MTHRSKWDQRFFEMAYLVASWSKDPSTQVGAVIVRPDKTVASVGFNGFPQWMDDHEDLYKDRSIKMSKIIHAEMNALLFCKEPKDCILYTYPFPPCDRCAVHLIQAGIQRVVAPRHLPERWRESLSRALDFFDEANVEVTLL